jgi:hypothetical protein
VGDGDLEGGVATGQSFFLGRDRGFLAKPGHGEHSSGGNGECGDRDGATQAWQRQAVTERPPVAAAGRGVGALGGLGAPGATARNRTTRPERGYS